MGFLDHSTNNIIVDAVLTDEGRRALARNDGTFQIRLFSLGDDEVDYTLIEKFGRQVGKEKIAKNTPVFEAQTDGQLAMRSRLLTLPSRLLRNLPILSVTQTESVERIEGPGAQLVGIQMNKDNASRAGSISIAQVMPGGADLRIPDGLYDSSFTITVPDRFVLLSNLRKISVSSQTRIATYRKVSSGAANAGGGSTVTISLALRTLDSTHFDVFSTARDANRIDAVINIIGDQSGLRKTLRLQIIRNGV